MVRSSVLALHHGFRQLTWTLDSFVYFETLQRKLESDYRPETRGGERLVHAKQRYVQSAALVTDIET